MTINESSGNDSVNISPFGQFLDQIQGNVKVNGGSGYDTLTIADTGGGSGLDFFGVTVTYDGSGTNSVLLDDSTAPFSDTYDITSSTFSRSIFGGLTYSNVASLTSQRRDGQQHDQHPRHLRLGDGQRRRRQRHRQRRRPRPHLRPRQSPGAVTVNGGGSDHINVNDQDAGFSDTYDITSSKLSRIIFGGLTYSGISGLTLNAETGNNTINIHSTSAPVTIKDDAGSDTFNVGDRPTSTTWRAP